MDANLKRKLTPTALYSSLLAFVVFALYILYMNKEVLHTAEERSEFLIGTPFFDTLMAKPFGLMQYVGAWLTQFLYDPVVGGGMLVSIWGLIFLVGIKAFRLQGSASALMLLPVAFLLTSIVDLGYWIYIFRIKGYWFSQSVGYLVMLLLLWGARRTPRKWHLVWYLFAICAYPVLGWFALLFVVCLAFTDKLSWREALGLVLLLFTANIWHFLLYADYNLNAVMMAGIPIFETPSDKSVYLSYPFWSLGAISILISLFGRHLDKWFAPIPCAIVGMIFIGAFMFQDNNYVNEMRMVRAAEDENWKEVLDIYEESPEPTHSLIMLKNVALMNEGGLLDRSFQMGNNPAPLNNPDSIHVSFLEIASPVAYYHYGILNEGFRLAFECAVQSGFCPFYLKALSRCASANGEKALLERYVVQLHAHPFYTHWQPAPATENILELHSSYPDELTGVESSYSYIVNSICYWYKKDSKLASEQALFYSMMGRNPQSFWPSLRKFVKMHQNENFPVHAQEAYILFIDRHQEEKKMMIPVSEDIYERYQEFWTALENLYRSTSDKSTIPETMHEAFGDTYWYYYVFGRQYAAKRESAASY